MSDDLVVREWIEDDDGIMALDDDHYVYPDPDILVAEHNAVVMRLARANNDAGTLQAWLEQEYAKLAAMTEERNKLQEHVTDYHDMVRDLEAQLVAINGS